MPERDALDELLGDEEATLQQELTDMDLFIKAISSSVIRLREIKDVFMVSVREKKRATKVKENTLISRKMIYESTETSMNRKTYVRETVD